jgi:hypothetical protein
MPYRKAEKATLAASPFLFNYFFLLLVECRVVAVLPYSVQAGLALGRRLRDDTRDAAVATAGDLVERRSVTNVIRATILDRGKLAGVFGDAHRRQRGERVERHHGGIGVGIPHCRHRRRGRLGIRLLQSGILAELGSEFVLRRRNVHQTIVIELENRSEIEHFFISLFFF